jgi:hypothetical protein
MLATRRPHARHIIISPRSILRLAAGSMAAPAESGAIRRTSASHYRHRHVNHVSFVNELMTVCHTDCLCVNAALNR